MKGDDHMGRPRKKKEERFKKLLAGIAACEPLHHIKDVLEKEIQSLTVADFEEAVRELGTTHLEYEKKRDALCALDLCMRCAKQRERRRLL